MADPRFFDNKGPLPLAKVLQLTGAACTVPGATFDVADVAGLESAGPAHLTYCESPKYKSLLAGTRAGAVLMPAALASSVPDGALALVVPQPSLAFAKITSALYPDAGLIWPVGKPPLEAIAASARIGRGTVIAPGAFVGENVEIGDDCVIGPGAVIGRGVRIGHRTQIGPRVTLTHALVGDRCIVHPGCSIGQDGFGFAGGPGGHFKIPQVGRVIIQDNVELGAGVTIDRGAMADTVIGEGTKIDNLVQIGHNSHMGRHCIMVSQSGLSGSCDIGDFTVIGGQVGVADHVKIGKGAFLASRSGVSRSLEGGKVYGGFPARPIEHWRREIALLSRLVKGRQTKNDGGGSHD